MDQCQEWRSDNTMVEMGGFAKHTMNAPRKTTRDTQSRTPAPTHRGHKMKLIFSNSFYCDHAAHAHIYIYVYKQMSIFHNFHRHPKSQAHLSDTSFPLQEDPNTHHGFSSVRHFSFYVKLRSYNKVYSLRFSMHRAECKVVCLLLAPS